MNLLTPSILDADRAEAVERLARDATTADGVGPLSEAARLALHHPGRHVVAVEGDSVVGYGVREQDVVELVVDPTHRRRGTGSAILDAGEVYVVGVDPSHQGKGLGSLVTLLGLDHLRARGLRTVELYVDGDHEAAVRTYERLGFTNAAVDVQYGHR